ncbi:hypothetical protein Neosp_012897 [[Neocosmospora] mangrovei]
MTPLELANFVPSYNDQRSSQGAPDPPPTPSTTATDGGVPSKDGLGPKIWTGTHFLPRFVRAAEVPGEGMCYFYDDGSHCKPVIDGEAVNAHWGVTKAGKPRKRLAIACVTCREKKIKCDPDYPRCVQCEKFGRVCKFKNHPRNDSPEIGKFSAMTPLELANSPPFVEQRIDKLNAINAESFDPLLNPRPESVRFSQPVPPSASEQDILDVPEDAQPSAKPNPPSNSGRDDSQKASHPEDSGYGSIAAAVYFPVRGTKDAAEEIVGVADDDADARTTYSKVTNEDPLTTRDFVHELASDIHGNLKASMCPDDWPLVLKSLPELLKAFAIRIGSNGASQASRDVMYFIHKKHRTITDQFKRLLLDLADDDDASCVDNDMDIMPLQDKIDMWRAGKISIQESAPQNSELFQNVADDDTNITASLLYSKMVLESEDYSWLLQRLETELSLERGETKPLDLAIVRRETAELHRRGLCTSSFHRDYTHK